MSFFNFTTWIVFILNDFVFHSFATNKLFLTNFHLFFGNIHLIKNISFFFLQFHPFIANKYQSNLNEIDKFEHKSSLDDSNKGFGWPTGHIGINLGKFNEKKWKL